MDRFTRDEVSAKVWWPLALLFVVIALLTFRMEDHASEERREAAAAWSVDTIRERLAPALGGSEPTRPLSEDDAQAVTDAIAPTLESDAVDAVRLWSSDGQLLYSSLEGDPIGSREALNDDQLLAALEDPSAFFSESAERSPTGERTDPLLLTYATVADLRSTVGELQMNESALLADLSTRWLQLRVLFFGAALLVLALALLSMREPAARIGAGVKFYPESVPASMVVIDREEEVVLRQAGGHTRRRTESLDRRIEELEASKLELEGELQRSLSALAALRASKGVTPRAIPAASSPPPPVVRVPEASGSPAERPEAPRENRERPALLSEVPPPVELRVVREPVRETEPETRPQAAPPIEEPAARTREAPLASEPVVVVPELTPEAAAPPKPEPAPEPKAKPKPEPKEAELKAKPEAKPEPKKPEPAAKPESKIAEPVVSEPLLDLVVLPEADPEPVPVSTRPAAAAAEADAVDVLNRLVPPVESRGAIDPSEIRAKLARTAALKKPGSRERREEEERRAKDNPGAR